MDANAVGLLFQTGTPPVMRGSMGCFICLSTGKTTGMDGVKPLYYLNEYPLEYDECKCSKEHDDGCPTTGWFYDESNFDYENCYYQAAGEIVAWAELPSPVHVRAALAKAEART